MTSSWMPGYVNLLLNWLEKDMKPKAGDRRRIARLPLRRVATGSVQCSGIHAAFWRSMGSLAS